MSQVNKAKEFAKNNIDAKIVVSSVVAAFVVGGIIYAANKTGIKPVKQIANLAK